MGIFDFLFPNRGSPNSGQKKVPNAASTLKVALPVTPVDSEKSIGWFESLMSVPKSLFEQIGETFRTVVKVPENIVKPVGDTVSRLGDSAGGALDKVSGNLSMPLTIGLIAAAIVGGFILMKKL